MKKKISIILCLYFLFFLANQLIAYEHELVICAITRDENEYLEEWVKFHLKQGVDHIYLYDNLSKVSPAKDLKKYIDKGLVDVVNWPVVHTTNGMAWGLCQFGAYKNFAKKNKHKAKWAIFIDTDEFIFCPDGKNIKKFLKKYETYQQVLATWVQFGTGHVKKAPKGKLIKHLLLRSAMDYFPFFKSIVRVDKIIGVNSPHVMDVQDPKLSVDENYRVHNRWDGERNPNPTFKKIRINHYFLRDEDFFWNVKVARWIARNSNLDFFFKQAEDCNLIYDDLILRCAR